MIICFATHTRSLRYVARVDGLALITVFVWSPTLILVIQTYLPWDLQLAGHAQILYGMTQLVEISAWVRSQCRRRTQYSRRKNAC